MMLLMGCVVPTGAAMNETGASTDPSPCRTLGQVRNSLDRKEKDKVGLD